MSNFAIALPLLLEKLSSSVFNLQKLHDRVGQTYVHEVYSVHVAIVFVYPCEESKGGLLAG